VQTSRRLGIAATIAGAGGRAAALWLRRLGWLLAREGHAPNHKKLYRLYREERLMVRRRRGRKRALGTRAPMTLPITINQRWSLDFGAP
jgi:transposase InsO family protein